MLRLRVVTGILLLILLLLLPWIVGEYTLHLAIHIMTVSILGLAFSLCWKVGMIRIDLAGWWGIGAYTTGILLTKTQIPFWPTMLIAGLVAVLIGWGIFSIAIPRGVLVVFAFGMLWTMLITQLFGSVPFFGGWGGIENIPRPFIGSFVFYKKTHYYFLGLLLLGINFLTYYLLYKSRIGWALTAIGSSTSLAQSLGVNIVRHRMACTLLGCFFTGISGSFYACYSLFIIPNTFDFLQSVYAQMYSLIGGLNHYLAGPVVGAAIIVLVPEYLRIAAEIEPVFSGLVLILIVIFLPTGIWGRLEHWLPPLYGKIRRQKGYIKGKSVHRKN